MQYQVRGVLLDIEGTTSSISFVYDVMFPFVRRELDRFLRDHGDEPAVIEAFDLIARDAGYDSFAAWCGTCGTTSQREECLALLRAEVLTQMDEDRKTTGLKALQGMIWSSGFESGELVAHVFDDVPPALAAWHQQALDLRVYSSGSVAAQKLFFEHTAAGNLLPYFSAHYDTAVGPKREAASYRLIVAEFRLDPAQVLFLSDVVAELDAARAAGLETALLCRPGNATVTAAHAHPSYASFADLPLG